MKALIVAGLLTASVAPSFAQSGSYYDYRTGNNYRWQNNGSGTTLYGNNYGTGSSWHVQQNRNGSYNGRDANGNYFSGNNNTGQYYNYGTGRSCYGTGYARSCY